MSNKDDFEDEGNITKSKHSNIINQIKETISNKQKLRKNIKIVLLFIVSCVAIFFACEKIVEIDFDEDGKPIFTQELIFIIIYLGLAGYGIKQIISIIKVKEKKVEIEQKKPQTIKSLERNTVKQAFGYLVLLPIIYMVFSIIGFIIIFHDRSHTTILELQNVLYIPVFVFWGIIGSYAWKHTKISTAKEYFAKIGYNNIILERLFVNKIRNIGILATIVFLPMSMILNVLISDQPEFSINDWLMLVISFGIFNIAMFSYLKIVEQEKKKRFKLFMASGFCKLCLKNKDSKVKNLTRALKWYSDFLKKSDHQGIKQLDKIVIRILASDSSSTTIGELINLLESDKDYSSVNKLAKIMNVNVDELFEDETFIQKITRLIIPIGGLAAIGTFILYVYQIFQPF